MGDGDEAINLSPSFFLLRMSSGLASPFPAACSSSALSVPRASCRSLPVLLVVRLGVRRGVVCRAVVRCGVAYRSSLVSRVGRLGGVPAFLVSWLSAGGGSLAMRGSSRLIGAGGGPGSSACLDEADGGVCGLCGASFYRLITSVEAGILFLVP